MNGVAKEVLDYGPDLSRLLVQIMQTLAQGRPVAKEQTDRNIADVGIERDKADRFLSQVAERDGNGAITGIMGLSLNDHPHRLYVNGASLSAWCAMDTLFIPAMLNQTATIESQSPVSGQTVRVTVSPQKVEVVNPAGAVISFVVVEPGASNVNSVEAIWGTFCCHIHFFASRAEAEQWAAGREDIEILSVEEGFELGKLLSSKFLAET